MKKFSLLCSMLLCLLSSFASGGIGQVNSIIGDKSFVERFGYSPTDRSNETLRLETHLAYVEHLLSAVNANNLSKQQQSNRKRAISLLHEYWNRGIFPSNYDYPNQRRPCFIDKSGNICAVGYLIEKTMGRRIAEQINSKHQNDYILDMQEPIIKSWAKEFGLSLMECAIIQPQYGPALTPVTKSAEIETNYGITSGVISGINFATAVTNFSNQSGSSSTFGYIGLITGTTQILLGATNVKKSTTFSYVNGPQITTTYGAQNNLSYFNIAMGTATIVSSTIRLLTNKKKESKNAYSIFSYPNENNALTLGIAIKRRI